MSDGKLLNLEHPREGGGGNFQYLKSDNERIF